MFTLSQLVDASQNSESHVFTAPALAQAMKEINAEKEKEVSAACANLIRKFLANLETNVRALREIRKREAAQAKAVKNLDRAVKFFGETGNPLPVFKANADGSMTDAKCLARNALCHVIDFCHVPDDAWNVPDDWQPKAEPKAA